MGVSYYIVNTSKRQCFKPGDLLSGDRFTGLLHGLSGHALSLLIQDSASDRPHVVGLWAGDALYAVGDSSVKSVVHAASTKQHPSRKEAWEILREEYVDITTALAAELCEHGYGKEFLTAAESDESLFVNLANLIEQFDLPSLRHAFLDRFGKNWWRRYNQVTAQSSAAWGTLRVWDLESVRGILSGGR